MNYRSACCSLLLLGLAVAWRPGVCAGRPGLAPDLGRSGTGQSAHPASGAPIKLFLKDGSYQLVSSYEVRGDRVRYYSVERSQWEEVPTSLVDFEATKKTEEETKTQQQKSLDEAKQIEQERYEKIENQGYEAAPGVRLPQEDGVYTLDGLRVVRLIQSSAEVTTDKKRAALLLALPGPFLKSRSLVVLSGPKAAVRLDQYLPVFYVQSAEGLGSKLELIKVKPGKQARLVETVESRGGIGKSTELRSAVTLERAQVAPGVYKLTPTRALEPGEYALGELIQEKLNLELWDFGIGATPGK